VNGKADCAQTRLRSAAGLAILAVLAGPVLASYGFDLTPRGDTVRLVGPGEVAEFHFTLVNTGTSTDVFRFDCRVVSAVPGWTVVYCVRGVCVEPGIPVYDTLQGGGADTTAKVTVYTDTTPGEEVVSLRVRSMGDTTLAESVATHTIVGAGVVESSRPRVPGSSLRIAPSVVNRQTGAVMTFSTPKQAVLRVTLHDAGGRLVQTVACGVLSAGPHRIRWRPEPGLAGGVYLLRLSSGAASATTRVVVE